jgi:EAL domain-containing protein (putative c-di-GMP-specific phosphodiesterase class I)
MKGGNEKIFRPDVIFLKMPRSKLGRTLDVAVVAEGVETQDQADALLAIGCRAVQGFYFARLLSVNDATNLLRIPRE